MAMMAPRGRNNPLGASKYAEFNVLSDWYKDTFLYLASFGPYKAFPFSTTLGWLRPRPCFGASPEKSADFVLIFLVPKTDPGNDADSIPLELDVPNACHSFYIWSIFDLCHRILSGALALHCVVRGHPNFKFRLYQHLMSF